MKKKSMKLKLMIQSLSLLALLTVIRNFKFENLDEGGYKLKFYEFVSVNKILLIVILPCFVWILLSLWYYQEFKAFNVPIKKRISGEQGKRERGS